MQSIVVLALYDFSTIEHWSPFRRVKLHGSPGQVAWNRSSPWEGLLLHLLLLEILAIFFELLLLFILPYFPRVLS